MPTPYEPFDGTLGAARERLRKLAAAACHVLDARMLNALSLHLAVYMDTKAGDVTLTDRMLAEIEAEQRRWPGRLQ
jgi:hypothetical protein